MSIDSRTFNTGPAPATLQPMTVDMVGPKGTFGRLNLPEVKTNIKGADVIIRDQLIKITDLDAYLAFQKSIQLDEKLTMLLDNGIGQIKALGILKASIKYKKEVTMLGMDGPQTEILKTEVLADGTFKNTMKIINPSPVEIDMGNVSMLYKSATGEVLAEQTANIFIVRGETIYEATGKVIAKGAVDSVHLVGGKELSKSSIIKHTLEHFDVPVALTPELKQLLAA
jgi:Protein of unknown function (DUF3712)